MGMFKAAMPESRFVVLINPCACCNRNDVLAYFSVISGKDLRGVHMEATEQDVDWQAALIDRHYMDYETMQ